MRLKDIILTILSKDIYKAMIFNTFRRVGGWRQKEKPLLYNVFHIGDQIVRVGRCNVSSASDVHRLIKNDTGSQVSH